MEYLTVKQVVEMTGRKQESITRACRRGTLKASWIGRQWLIRPDDLEEYLNNPPKPGRKSLLPKPPPLRVEIDPRSRLAIKDKRQRPKDDKGVEGDIPF